MFLDGKVPVTIAPAGRLTLFFFALNNIVEVLRVSRRGFEFCAWVLGYIFGGGSEGCVQRISRARTSCFLAGRTSPLALCRFIETFVEERGNVDMANLFFVNSEFEGLCTSHAAFQGCPRCVQTNHLRCVHKEL